ncbi:MAG: cation diffusion facilitator family transporter [Planctomycetota bacterium]|nr:cation diffusion facilitator family transporter [Planctomycetota bacterium]
MSRTQEPSPRFGGHQAHRTNLVGNGLMAVGKLVAGFLTGSPALTADGVHSLGDLATGAVAWLSFRWAGMPADEDHHYGHGKAEAVAGCLVGLMLIGVGLEVFWEALSMRTAAYSGGAATLALGTAVASIGVNLWLARITRRTGDELHSQSLLALSRDNSADALTGVLVVVALVLSLTGFGQAEPVVAALIGVLVTIMGWESVRAGYDVLMDRVPDPHMRARIRALALPVEGVVEIQAVDVHPLGAHVRVDMEISVDGELSVRKGHEIAHEVESAVTRGEKGVVEVAVHVNPASSGPPSATDEPASG